jgi:hypothetical protein
MWTIDATAVEDPKPAERRDRESIRLIDARHNVGQPGHSHEIVVIIYRERCEINGPGA